jgi:hypothetical protein
MATYDMINYDAITDPATPPDEQAKTELDFAQVKVDHNMHVWHLICDDLVQGYCGDANEHRCIAEYKQHLEIVGNIIRACLQHQDSRYLAGDLNVRPSDAKIHLDRTGCHGRFPDAHNVFLHSTNQRFCVTQHGCETKEDVNGCRTRYASHCKKLWTR